MTNRKVGLFTFQVGSATVKVTCMRCGDHFDFISPGHMELIIDWMNAHKPLCSFGVSTVSVEGVQEELPIW